MAWGNFTSAWTAAFPSGFQAIRALGLRLIPSLRFRSRLIAAVVLVLSTGALWYKAGMQQRILKSLTRIDPIPHTRELTGQNRYAQAHDYLSFFRPYDYVASNHAADTLLKDIQTRRDSYAYRLRKISQGILTGQSDEREGQISAVISDFLIIGDIRDLAKEGINYAAGRKVDELTAALSAVGIALTTGTIFSAGGAATAKMVLSFLKMMNNINEMPDWLRQYLIEKAKVVKENRSTGSLRELFDMIYRLLKATGVRGTVALLNRAHDMDSFTALADFGIYFQDKTPVLLELTGDTGVCVFHKNKAVPKNIFFEAATFGASGVDALGMIGPDQFELFLKHDAAAARMAPVDQTHPRPMLDAMRILLWHAMVRIPAWVLGLSMVCCSALIVRRSQALHCNSGILDYLHQASGHQASSSKKNR
jgi:hypothetical protein